MSTLPERVTPAMIQTAISSVWYANAAESIVPDDFQPPVSADHVLTRVTLCYIVTVNGHTLVGVNACVSAKEWDPVKAKQLAYEQAEAQLWGLEAYRLRQLQMEQRGE
jgi:hypothetical protein